MNWGNVLPILSILVPVLIGLWGIMRSIKEEIRSVRNEMERRLDNLDHKIDMAKAELKEDTKIVRDDMRSLQEMLWVSIVGKKPDFYDHSGERKQG